MKQDKLQFTLKNISMYVTGVMILGLGVNLMLRSELGAGAWDATNFNLNDMMSTFISDTTITYGTTSLMITLTLFLLVMLYRRFDTKLWMMLIPTFTVAFAIDFWDLLVLNNFHPESIIIRTILYIIGLFVLPLGLSIIIASSFPATVYDEITLVLKEIFKVKNYGYIRMGFEITGVLLAIIFGFIAGVSFGAVSIGTLVMAITIGPVMNIYLKLFGIIKKD